MTTATCNIRLVFNWEHLPYVAVLKSGHTTATISSSIHFFSSWIKTAAVLLSVAKTAKVAKASLKLHLGTILGRVG